MVHGQDVYVSEATVDIENKALVLNTKAEDGGKLIVVPRVILDAKDGTKDIMFFVYADNELIDQEVTEADESTRVVSVLVPKDTETITITGTTVIPEFGTVAVIVLLAGIMGTVFATKSRHLLFN